MSIRVKDAGESEATKRLAQAMRSGLELRWSIPGSSPSCGVSAFPPHGDVRAFLEPNANILHHHFPRRGSWVHAFVHATRYLARKLIAPWLLLQSRFNLSSIRVVEQLQERVRSLEEANLALRETVKSLEKILLALVDDDLAGQVETFEEGVRLRINRELSGEGQIQKKGLWFDSPVQVRIEEDGPRIARVTERIVEKIFIHTHLPCPPAQLLSLGCADNTNAIEMASLGFQVVGVDTQPLPLVHPNFTMIPSRLDLLPFDDESFDGVIALSTLGRIGRGYYTSDVHADSDEEIIKEAFRVLKSGGRFLLTLPFGQRSITQNQRIYDRPQLDCLLQAFRVVERGYGVPEGNTWSFTFDERHVETISAEEGYNAVCLLVLEKP